MPLSGNAFNRNAIANINAAPRAAVTMVNDPNSPGNQIPISQQAVLTANAKIARIYSDENTFFETIHDNSRFYLSISIDSIVDKATREERGLGHEGRLQAIEIAAIEAQQRGEHDLAYLYGKAWRAEAALEPGIVLLRIAHENTSRGMYRVFTSNEDYHDFEGIIDSIYNSLDEPDQFFTDLYFSIYGNTRIESAAEREAASVDERDRSAPSPGLFDSDTSDEEPGYLNRRAAEGPAPDEPPSQRQRRDAAVVDGSQEDAASGPFDPRLDRGGRESPDLDL